MANYFEAVSKMSGDAKISANWIMGELSAALNKNALEFRDCPVTAELLGGMINRIKDNTISGKIAKIVFEAMWNGDGNADAIIEKKGLKQITDTGAIEKIIDDILYKNPDQLSQYRAGKDKLRGFFVGQVMQATKGKANPKQVNELLDKKLKGWRKLNLILSLRFTSATHYET